MKLWLKKLRRWWICRKYHICRTHGALMTSGGYNEPSWWCPVCREENMGRSIQRQRVSALERVEAQKRLNKDWSTR